MRVEFKVQGSSKEPYRVTFWRENDIIRSQCGCRAGQCGYSCKHRDALIIGDVTNLVSENYDDLLLLREIISGTDIAIESSEKIRKKERDILIKKFHGTIPDRRRKQIKLPEVIESLKNGFGKAGITPEKLVSYFDFYDENFIYVGSLKLEKFYDFFGLSDIFNGMNLVHTVKYNEMYIAQNKSEFATLLK